MEKDLFSSKTLREIIEEMDNKDKPNDSMYI